MMQKTETWLQQCQREGLEEVERWRSERLKSPEERLAEVEEVLMSLGFTREQLEGLRSDNSQLERHRGRKTKKEQEAIMLFERNTQKPREGDFKKRFEPC